MKIFYIILGVFLILMSVAFGDITCTETMTRSAPAQVTANADFQVTYTAVGVTGQWGASIVDSVSGGCTFPSGANTYQTVMLSEDGLTKTITVTAPAGGMCSFTGDYMYGTCALKNFAGTTVTIQGTNCTCTYWVNGDCSDQKRVQTRTCTPSACDSEHRLVDDPTCIITECTQDNECLAGGECRTGHCDAGECKYTNKATGTPCSLGECEGGVCKSTNGNGDGFDWDKYLPYIIGGFILLFAMRMLGG